MPAATPTGTTQEPIPSPPAPASSATREEPAESYSPGSAIPKQGSAWIHPTLQIEAREATRTVCRMIPVQEERTVCEVADRVASAAPAVIRTAGYQRESTVETLPAPPIALGDRDAPPPPAAAPLAGSAAAPGNVCCQPACEACPVVVPRKVTVTCMKPVSERETVQYPVTHLQPSARLETVSFYEFQPEKISHEERYVVDVPEQRVRTRQVAETRSVPVPVLRSVPQQISVPAAPPVKVATVLARLVRF